MNHRLGQHPPDSSKSRKRVKQKERSFDSPTKAWNPAETDLRPIKKFSMDDFVWGKFQSFDLSEFMVCG